MQAVVGGTGVVVAVDPPADDFAMYQRSGYLIVPCDADVQVGDVFNGFAVVTASAVFESGGAAREKRLDEKLTNDEFVTKLRESKR